MKYPFWRAAAGAAALAMATWSAPAAVADGMYPPGDPMLAAPSSLGGPISPFLANGKAVLAALDAIEAESGSPLRVTAISASDTEGLTVDVQEPKNHLNVDRYVVANDGTIARPVAVQIDPQAWDSSWDVNKPITAAIVDRQAFDPRALGFARLEQTAREAIKKSNLSDARVVYWEFKGVKPASARWLYMEGSRGKPVAQLDAGLRIVGFEYS